MNDDLVLKDAYASSTALFLGVTLPSSSYNDEIKYLVYNRWKYNLLIMEDKDLWHDFFEFKTREVWDMAVKLMKSAELIVDPSKQWYKKSDKNGSNTLTDTLQIVTDRESADATSGYNNTSTEGSGTTGELTKHSDTPQSSVNNLTSGYLSDATKTDGESTSTGETGSNYLDASSHNSNDTVTHSGGNENSYEDHLEEYGYNDQADMLLKYRETIKNIKEEVSNLWAECFDPFYTLY